MLRERATSTGRAAEELGLPLDAKRRQRDASRSAAMAIAAPFSSVLEQMALPLARRQGGCEGTRPAESNFYVCSGPFFRIN